MLTVRIINQFEKVVNATLACILMVEGQPVTPLA